MWQFRRCWQFPRWQSICVRTKKRTALGLILETAEPREVHHFATLLGYGACCHQPLSGAWRAFSGMIEDGLLDKDYYAAEKDYTKAILSRHCENSFENGRFHHSVLSGQPDI